MDPKVRRHWLAELVEQSALGIDATAQRLRKTFPLRGVSVLLLALVIARVGLAIDHDGEHAILSPEPFEISDLARDITGFHRPRRTDDDEKFAGLQRIRDRIAEIRIHGQFLLVAKDREDPLRDRVAAVVHGAHEIRGHLVSLDLLMQPRGPLAPGLAIVRVAVADEAPEFPSWAW